MTVLCFDNCHVWLGASPICTCEAERMALIGNYYPHFPPRPPTPPIAGQQQQAPEVPLCVFEAAQAVEDATHLSSDGKRVYIQRLGNVRVCFWDEEMKKFGSSFPCDEGLPADAMRM